MWSHPPVNDTLFTLEALRSPYDKESYRKGVIWKLQWDEYNQINLRMH